MKSKCILCIDDEPIRYRKFRTLTTCLVLTTCRMEDVKEYFRDSSISVVGICLDHDMPFGSGLEFATQFLVEKNIPVAITSANIVGANRIKTILEQFAVPVEYTPCSRPNWEQHALAFLRQ